jgi:hypothetical protein
MLSASKQFESDLSGRTTSALPFSVSLDSVEVEKFLTDAV